MPPQDISAERPKDDPSPKPKPPEESNDRPSGQGNGGQHKGGGNNTSGSVRNMGDVINSSLDAKFGGGGNDAPVALGDKVYAPPERDFHWSARAHITQANLAEARPSVTNMAYTVSDGNGGTKTISGPSATNGRGHEILLDRETGTRYRVTPPTEPGGQATLTPVRRGGDRGEPLTVVAQKAIDGWSPRQHGGDWNPPQRPDGNPREKPTQPAVADGQPVKPQPRNDGMPRPDGGGQPQPQGDGQPQGGWRNRGDRDHERGPNPNANPNDGAPTVQQVAQQMANAMRMRDGGGAPPTDASALPGNPARPGGPERNEGQFRCHPPMPPQQLEAIRQQLAAQHNPQAVADALARIQQLQQGLGQNPGQIAQLQAAAMMERGKQQQQQFTPADWQQFQLQQVAKLQQNQVGQPGQPGQQLDVTLRNLLTDKANQPALQLLLNELRTGKLPNEQTLQGNRPLSEIIKAIGPEGLVDLRRLMMTNPDGTAGGIRPLIDGRMDLTSLNPRSRDIVELLASQMRPTTPGALASDRLMDLVRLNATEGKMLGRVPDAETSRTNMLELGKILREMNVQNVVQNVDGRQITMRDIISRSIEHTGERREFVAELKPTTGELRQNIELRTDAKLVDAPKVDQQIRAERTTDKADVAQTVRTAAEAAAVADQFAQNKDLQPKRDVGVTDKDDKWEDDPLRKKELKPVKKQEEALPVDQAALAAALAEKKRREMEQKDKDREQAQEKDKKEAERRQKYIVRPGDTLESVATKMLRDKRLAGLIYEINKDMIPVVIIDRKKVPQLQERSVIWLPTPTEAKDYRGRMLAAAAETRTEFTSAEDELEARFGKNWNTSSGGGATTGGAPLEDLEDAAKAAYANRRKHIESLLGPLSSKGDSTQPKYVVRLGETLKSVAMKHPSLQDVTLWKLLAELNGLTTETDDKGNPLAKLNRGQSIILPSEAEIASFRQRGALGSTKTKISGVLELPTRICAGCKRQTFAAASLCPGCGRKFEDPPTATKPGATETKTAPVIKSPPPVIKTPPKTVAAPLPQVSSTQDAPSPSHTGSNLKKQFSDAARLMTAGTPEELNTGYTLRLELLLNKQWTPLVVYEVFTGTCLRHEVGADGQRKTIRIDLPPQAAIELANNDIETNWNAYASRLGSVSQV